MKASTADTILEILVQIKAPHFTAEIVAHGCNSNISDFKIVKAAPIIKYMIGWTLGQARSYCDCKRWSSHRIQK